jgi:uncharacterized protein YecT (DUF1311 family)
MTQDQPDLPPSSGSDAGLGPNLAAAARARPTGPGKVAIAGVFGACALGAGLGLWARPAPPERPAPPATAPEPPRPALQVVVDDSVLPPSAPLEVLPADLTPAPGAGLPRLIPVEPQAPRRPAAGLVRVDAVVAAPTATAPVQVLPIVKAVDPPEAAPKPTPAPARNAKARAQPEPRPAAGKTVRVAKTEKLKVDKAKAVKLAKAEPKPKPAVKAAAEKPARLAKLVKAMKAAPKTVAVKARAAAPKKKPDLRVAEPKPKLTKAKAVRTAAKPKVEKTKAQRPAPSRPAPTRRKAAPRGEEPMRVAKADACAAADPGEALVCADRRLAARDRQLQQAYRNAEAAGVPASALRRQQSRWVQARAAAAREAPWAVEDVYVARISELNDLSRDAREN